MEVTTNERKRGESSSIIPSIVNIAFFAVSSAVGGGFGGACMYSDLPVSLFILSPAKASIMQIGVIGSRRTRNEVALKAAYEVGRLIAKRGAILVCGGLDGVMEEACRGAKEEGGITVGILPGKSASDANPYVDVKVVTGMDWARNQLIALSSDGIIMIEGECGTLSEACQAWAYGKPIVAIAKTGGYSAKFAGKKIDDKRKDAIVSARDAKEAVGKIFSLIGVKR